MRKATVWLVVGLGGVGVGVVFALPVPVEAGVALIVLGVGIAMFAGIERTIETRRTETGTAQLDDKSRRLVEMIESRCDRVWEGIRDQRYVKHEDGQIAGPDLGAVFDEIEDIFREVATLYHPDSDNAVFEARIGDIALAVRSAVGELLELARQVVPYVDPTDWSLRKVMTRRDQIQKALKLYRTLSPYRYHVKGAMIAARLALGANPILLAAWYVGSEVAMRVGGQVFKSYVEARLKDPLERLVALVYLQAARTYDPRLAYRSADWVALVEALRIHARIPGIDHNRKLLLDHILRAQMLDELAKMALLRALAADREPDFQTIPLIDFALLLPEQRQEIADRLRDLLSEMEGLNVPAVGEIIEDLERRLQCRVEVDVIRSGSPDFVYAKKGLMRRQIRSAKTLLWRGWRSGRRAPGETRRRFLGRALGLACAGLAGPARADDRLFLLGLEEHFATPELQRLNNIRFPKGALRSAINDVGAGRIADMDAAGIDLQVLSALTPGAQNIPGPAGVAYTRRLNEWVAREVIPAYPHRFRAFATLPLSEPEAAPAELDHAVRKLGFLGAMTYGAVDGKFLDHADFQPVLARAEALGVPVYIHPGGASPAAMDLYYSDVGDPLVGWVLSGAGYGWHQEVALQCLRMIVSGVFDRFPKLQIIIGHMGEGLPFFYWRFGDDLARATEGKLEKPVQQYFHDNFWITTSAFFRDELLTLVLSVMGEDRVMFSVDYPFASNKRGADWFRAVDLPRATKEKIAHRNAERLLKIGPF